MSEQLANLYGSIISSVPVSTMTPSVTLASPYTAGSGAISVSSATGAPSGGTFSLTILNAKTGQVYLIFRVTSVSGTTFSGASEGPDSNAPLGAAVVGTMLTTASMQQIMKDALAPVTNANLVLAGPTSGSAAAAAFRALVAADLPATAVTPGSYTSTDLTVDQQGRITAAANGSGGDGGFIQPLTAPDHTIFSQINFNTGSGVVTTEVDNSSPVTSITLCQSDPGNTLQLAAIAKVKINALFTLTAAFSMYSDTGSSLGGIWLYDGTSNSLVFGVNTSSPGAIIAQVYSNLAGSFARNAFGTANCQPIGPLMWLQIQETVSARIYSISSDGINFFQVFSESNTAQFVTLQYGFETNSRAAGLSTLTCYSFSETTP